jgi:hypothetical protein
MPNNSKVYISELKNNVGKEVFWLSVTARDSVSALLRRVK